MDKELWERVRRAAEDSIKNPGQNEQPLPKAQPRPGQNFIVVFRHGESEDNRKKIFSGWRDPDITDRGREQAAVLTPKLKALAINLAITSDQKRSQETARIALADNAGVRFEQDARIKERNYGDLNGKSKEEAMRIDPEQAILWRRSYDVPPPNGENIKMVEERVWPFLDELKNRIRREKINVALSMHGNSMRAARRYLENMDIVTEMTHENPLASDYALYVIE